MEVIFLLILISIVFIAGLAIALFWSVKTGQFDDVEGQGQKILMDDDSIQTDENKSQDE